MIKRAQYTCFIRESIKAFCILGNRWRKNLDRHGSAKSGIAGPIYLTHSAGTWRRQNLIRAKLCTWSKRHQCGDYNLIPLRCPASGLLPSICLAR